MTVTRFAPSPTGRLHVGNLRAAVLSWALARQAGGRFLLRLDDTDRARSTEAFADGIRDDLRWLGLTWDGEVRQSDRLALYEAAADRLRTAGLLYPAFETEAELDLARHAALAAGRPPVYDRAALRLTAAERARLAAERPPAWRFRLPPGRIGWEDRILGPRSIDLESLSDPVLVRADGQVLYTLASVVDDAGLGVTDVLRGADHVANTAVQIALFHALGAAPPRFAHVSLLTGPGGAKLSKREGATDLARFRARGVEPLALLSLLARLGSARPVEPCASHAAIVAGLDLCTFGAAPVTFDEASLGPLTAKVLHALPAEAVDGRLAALGIPEPLRTPFWETVRGNLATFDEAAEWWAVCTGRIEAPVAAEDRDFAATALALLPPPPWDGESWATWTRAVSEATGRRGAALYRPLRLLVTGRDRGPEMARLMPLIGRA